ncbi:hypothetical protein M9Y10_040903 [Tritrichomonas musculus]|uniref:BEACH domain-containing protein n=1 Tax=Tritrichomonas musculus TaxID=1915356 RepID=A0ABR2K5Y6_9EUKA
MYEYESAPLARILELGRTADFNKVTSNCPYFMLFKNNPLPKVPTSTISLIQEMHQSKEQLSQILYDMEFQFPVITQSISEISQNIDKMSENNKIYSSIFLFYSFFAWFINYTKTGLVYPGDIVLTSLLSIKIENSQSYEILAKSAFYYGYKSLVESKMTPLFDKYIPTASKFFISQNDKKTYPNLIPIISGSIFIDILSHFEDPNQTANDQISFSSELFDIVNMIYDSSILHPYIFNEKIICYIFDFFKAYMCKKADINTSNVIIKCFSSLLKISNSDFNFLISNNLLDIILIVLNQNLQELSKTNINEGENDKFDFPDQLIILPNNLEIIQDFSNSKTQTFSNGFDPKPLKKIIIEEDPQKIYKSIYDDFNPLIQAMFNHENNIKALISAFVALFDANNDTSEINHMAFYLLFILSCINQKKKSSTKSTIKFSDLIHPILSSMANRIDLFFDPKVTVFESFLSEEMNSIRNEFLINIVQRKKKLHLLLTFSRFYPVIFIEIVYRLTSLNIRIPNEFLDEIMNFYRFMNISNIETKVVEIVREALFNYISIVSYDSILDGLSIQTSYFLCLIEDNLADEIIKILTNYFKNVGTVIDTKNFVIFLKLFQMHSIEDEENVIKVMVRFVKLLISIFNIKISFSRAFKSTFLEIFNILSQIKMSEELLKLVMSLFILISPEYQLSDIEAFFLKKAILNMYPSFQLDNHESLFNDILKLISIDNSHIYNCQVLPISYLLFSSVKFNELINDFLYKSLLQNSPNAIENCQKCHLVDFDCFLLDKLSEMKEEDYSIENEEKVKKILTIFEIIAKYFSSPAAVLKFASLLKPKNRNKKVLSKYMPLFMNTLSQLVEVDYLKKTKHMKLDEADEYCGDFIVPKSFSICFWICCRSFDSEGNLNVFTANSFDRKNPKNQSSINDNIKIYICNNELNFEINQFHCSCSIKKDEWTFITVSFTKKSVNVYVNLVILSMILTSKFTDSYFCSTNMNEYVAFHGKIGDSSTVSSKETIELGFFGVLNFQKIEDMKKLFHNGVFSYPINPIFSYNISNHPNLSDTSTLTDSSLISSQAISVTSIVFNFVFCLTNMWKCDILIPLYSILDIPFEQTDNEYYTELPYITTYILTKCLVFNPKLQNHFFKTNKIRMISYLLYLMSISLSPRIVFDIRLYQYFYKMYLCVSNKDLHSQIYFTIIANLKIINYSSSNDHLKILESWLSDVYQVPHFDQIGSFSVLLSMMNIFYKYEEIDSKKVDFYINRLKEEGNKKEELNKFNDYIEIIQKEVEEHNNQIAARRKIFHHLLLFSADKSFNLSDYYEIVNQCIVLYKKAMKQQSINLEDKTNEEIRESSFVIHNYIKDILDMIRFLDLLIRQSPTTFKNMKIAVDDVLMLNELIIYEKYNDEQIIINLIDVITQFYKQEVFDEVNNQNLSIHYDLIINILSQAKLTSYFFESLIRHAHKSSPELYLICCWFLTTHEPTNEEFQELFVSSLLSSFNSIPKKTLSDPLFLFWSCSFSNILMTEKNQKILFAFIISILEEKWHLMLPSFMLFSNSQDSKIMLYLHIASIILFNKYNNINYSNKVARNLPLKQSRMIRSFSAIPAQGKASLNSFFTSSSNFDFVTNNNYKAPSKNPDDVEIEDDENENDEKEEIVDEDIKCFPNKELGEKDLIVFLKFSIMFILLRPNSIKISMLEKMFIQSPFMEENHEIVQSENDTSLQMFLNNGLDKNVTTKKENKSTLNHGLRFDEEMNWLDLEFAKIIFNMRMNYILHSTTGKVAPIVSQNEIKLYSILMCFISHVTPEFHNLTIEKINKRQTQKVKFASNSNSSSLDQNSFKLVFIPIEDKKMTNDMFSDIYDGSLLYLNEIRSTFIQIQSTISQSFGSSTKKIENLAFLQKKILKDTFHSNENNESKELSPFTENGITKLKRFMSLLEEFDKQQWEKLKEKLMTEKGPWNDDSLSSFFFKRSMTFCANFCPFLMKRESLQNEAKPRKNHSLDYYNNSDFFFWSHNRFLPLFEQTAFLNSNLPVIEKQTAEKAVIFECILQKIEGLKMVKLKIEPHSISIILDDEIKQAPKTVFIDKKDVLILMAKCVKNGPEKVEIFTVSCSKSYLLICANANAIIDLFEEICKPQQDQTLIIKDNAAAPDSFLANLQKKWSEKKCSNFEYIMLLNIFACRSFNDISQYPVFPLILNNYSDEKIDLNDETIFRDISKSSTQKSGFLPPSTVANYMKRVSPFKEISQKFNDDSKSDDDHSILNDIQNSKEGIPEFFFMPELLCDEVSNPTEYVYHHRKALESDFVSSHLNEWIDIVFGVRQGEISGQFDKSENQIANPIDEFVAVANDASNSLLFLMKKEELPCQIFTSPHPARNQSGKDSSIQTEADPQIHHYLIKNQDEWEFVVYAYFDSEYLYVFDSSFNVSKFAFKFDTFELNFIEKKPIVAPSKDASSDISFYQEFGFYLTSSSFISQRTIKSIIVHSNIELNSFCLIGIDSNFNISLKKFYLNFNSSNAEKENHIKLTEKNSLHSSQPDKDLALIKIECSDGHFIVVSNSDELHLSILEITDDNDDYLIKRYEQFIAVPKCCSISSIFETFVVATDNGSMQIVSVRGQPSNTKEWHLSKIVEFENNENIFIPQKILITDSLGFIVVYGKMKMSVDKNESFIYLFTINGIFIRKQKIAGEVVNWTKWKSKNGFDFLALIIKKKSENLDDEFNINDHAVNDSDDYDDIEKDATQNANSYGFSYKIAVCEAFYLKLDTLKYRFNEKIVALEFLVEKNLLAVFQSDGNFFMIDYNPNDMYVE